MHRLSFLLAALCILYTHTSTHTCVHAHNWLISPVPRGGAEANTASPCEALTSSSKVTPVTKGQPLMVTWSDNHQDNNVHALGIASYGEDGSVSDFVQLYSVPSGTASHQLPSSTFSSYTLGASYTLRYTWSTWDNCATLRIAAPTPPNTLSPTTANVTQSPVTDKPLQDGDYIVMDASTPVGVFNIYTDQTTCVSGYTEKNKSCVSKSSGGGGGMSGGGKAALSLFIIALACVGAYAGYSYYKTGDALHAVRPLIAKVSSRRSKRSAVATSEEGERNTGSYSAFRE